MVSNAREDFPDPDTPVTTVSVLCGISKSMFLRLWTRAPRTTMFSVDILGSQVLGSDILESPQLSGSRVPRDRSLITRFDDGSAKAGPRPVCFRSTTESFYYKRFGHAAGSALK